MSSSGVLNATVPGSFGPSVDFGPAAYSAIPSTSERPTQPERLTQAEGIQRVHEFVFREGAERAKERSKKVILFTDVDLTEAHKPRNDFGSAQFCPHTSRDMVAMSQTGVTIVKCSGRGYGQLNVIHDVNHAAPTSKERLFRFILASNLGGMIHYPDNPKPTLVVPDGLTMNEFIAAGKISLLTARHIHGFMMGRYPGIPSRAITLEPRELTSAVVFKQEKDCTFPNLKAAIAELIERFSNDPAIMDRYELTPGKPIVQTKEKFNGRNGYFDLGPIGLRKERASEIIVQNVIGTDDPNDYFVGAWGDSGPDLDMMKGIAKIIPPENRIFGCVGHDPDLVDSPLVNMVTSPEDTIDVIHRGERLQKTHTRQLDAIRRHRRFMRGLKMVLVDGKLPPINGDRIDFTHPTKASIREARARGCRS